MSNSQAATSVPEKTKPQVVEDALMQHIQRLKNPHEQHHMRQCISSLDSHLSRAETAGNLVDQYARIYALYKKEAENNPHSEATALKIAALGQFAKLYGIELTPEQQKLACDRHEYLEQKAAVAKEHECDIRLDFGAISDKIAQFDKNKLINECLSGKIGVYAADAAEIARDVRSSLLFIQNELSKFDPEIDSSVPFFDRLVDAQIDSYGYGRAPARVCEMTGIILNKWRDHIKYEVLGVVKPVDSRAAVKRAIEENIAPSRLGRPDAPRVDGRKIRSMELELNILGGRLQERHDVGLFLTHSDWYHGTNGNGGTRELANRVVRNICASLGKECPELNGATVHGSQRARS